MGPQFLIQSVTTVLAHGNSILNPIYKTERLDTQATSPRKGSREQIIVYIQTQTQNPLDPNPSASHPATPPTTSEHRHSAKKLQ